MGTSFIVANVRRGEYVRPGVFGDNDKVQDFGVGYHASAVLMLSTDMGRYRRAGGLAGSWVEDAVQLLTSDMPVNTHGVQTTKEDWPLRNMYHHAVETFEDISIRCLDMICSHFIWLPAELVDRLPKELGQLQLSSGFVFLSRAALLHKGSRLEHELEKKVGPNWKSLYMEVKELFDED